MCVLMCLYFLVAYKYEIHMDAQLDFSGTAQNVTTKAHQGHEGSPYSPFETTPRSPFSTTSGRPWGGFQTLTNFSEGNHKVRFLYE